MNPHLLELNPYPFERLAKLKGGVYPAADKKPINLSIGEPQHPQPKFIQNVIERYIDGLSQYPTTVGAFELREAIANWLIRRFALPQGSLEADRHILPVNGTREALFAIAQCLIEPKPDALVLMPNPFYQIYEGAALLAGAKPYYINATEKTNFLPDFDCVDEKTWRGCQLLYLCSPGNPTGTVLPRETLWKLIERAGKYGFIIAADECYSEIYLDELSPPTGLLSAAQQGGNSEFRNCLVFHSLSKRSSLPGMRSGFVAGDQAIIEKFRLYRTYHGSAMSLPYQKASAAAWKDEEHVVANRKLYKHKFDEVLPILESVMDVYRPQGGFYLWAKTPLPSTEFARGLFHAQNLTVLPGSYLSREAHGEDPGADRVRIALVAPQAECLDAAQRLRDYVQALAKT